MEQKPPTPQNQWWSRAKGKTRNFSSMTWGGGRGVVQDCSFQVKLKLTMPSPILEEFMGYNLAKFPLQTVSVLFNVKYGHRSDRDECSYFGSVPLFELLVSFESSVNCSYHRDVRITDTSYSLYEFLASFEPSVNCPHQRDVPVFEVQFIWSLVSFKSSVNFSSKRDIRISLYVFVVSLEPSVNCPH